MLDSLYILVCCWAEPGVAGWLPAGGSAGNACQSPSLEALHASLSPSAISALESAGLALPGALEVRHA